jgi:KRAB domain-containing zinc finger protein
MDKLQFHNFLEVKSISPKDPSGRDSEEERQLEEEMNEDEEEDDEGSYLDPSELLEQSDLIEDEAEEDDSSLLYPSVQMNTEGEDESVPDLEFLDPNAVAREPEFDNCHLKHKSPQFQCKKCDYVAQSSGTLTRHVSVVHKGVRWSCRLCGYVTTVKCSMVRHIQSIHQGWRYKCPFCPHESTQKGGLKYHIEKKHPEQLGAMPRWNSLAPVKTRSTTQIPGIEHMDVNQMFDELSDATSQDITDPVQKDLFSPIEGVAQMFARIREATPASPEPVAGAAEVGPGEEEVEEAESLEPSTAPGQYVGEDYDFTELYSRFTGYEDVSCDLCTYSTARMGNMRRHVLAVHQGVRFPCDLCNYRAPDKGSLLRHTRGVHQGIRYYCDFCPYSATQKGNLKKHQEMKHTDNNYDCMYCTFKVNWKGSFIKHLQSQHGDLMAAQGLGTTGETNPMLSFNVNTFADRSIQGMEEEEEEEELDKTEEGDSSLLCQEEEGELFQNQDAAEGYPIKTQNMSPTDKELEGSKVVVKTDSKQFQFKTEEMEGEIEDNGSSSTFQCSLCKYTANSSASLARHNGAVHKGIRWQCKDCDFITRDKSSLKRHRRNRHEGIRFKCNYCDYDAGQKGNIKSHMDRKHPEIPYDHTEFQEVKVEKSKYTREAKQEKEAVMRPDAQLAMSQMAAGLLGLGGLGGLNQFSAHLLTSLLQARMREDSNAFHSTDEDSNVQSSDKEEDQVDGHEEEDNNGAEVSEEPEIRKESRPSSPPSPGPSLTSTPVKEHSSILFNALRTLPSASASPTLTPRKSLLDLLKINQDVLEGEQEAEEGPSEQQMGARARRPAAPDDLADGLACLECTFTARSQGTLFRHVQSVHRGIRFTCEYCDFVTIDKGSLKRHVNGQHKGLKHKCDFCEYENAQIGNVKKHIQTKHQNIVYHCPYCSLEAKHKWYLEQHVRKLHTDKLFVFDIKNVTPQAAAITPEIQGFPALPSPAGLLPSPGIVPPSLMLLHPMAKFFVPDALKNAQEDKDDTATNKIEFQNYDDEASEMAGTD